MSPCHCRVLGSHGLFPLFRKGLRSSIPSIRSSIMIVLRNMAKLDWNVIRSYCLVEDRLQESDPLLGVIFDTFLSPETDLNEQLAEIITGLLDTSAPHFDIQNVRLVY